MGPLGARRVVGVGALGHVQHQRGIGRTPRDDPHRVERRGVGHEPVPREEAVRGLEPKHSAKRRGLSDAAPRVRTQGHVAQARRHGGRAPAGAATGRERWLLERCPGVDARPEYARRGRGAHAELIHVALPHEHAAGGGQAGPGRGVIGGLHVRQRRRPGGGAHACGGDVLLYAESHASQWSLGRLRGSSGGCRLVAANNCHCVERSGPGAAERRKHAGDACRGGGRRHGLQNH
mmetsp:Transcript_28/g.75  ORF Transcript_28/g.75 Transcript_28/m.75 type:complete len:234 (-) Transcript_28:68-769(-)